MILKEKPEWKYAEATVCYVTKRDIRIDDSALFNQLVVPRSVYKRKWNGMTKYVFINGRNFKEF